MYSPKEMKMAATATTRSMEIDIKVRTRDEAPSEGWFRSTGEYNATLASGTFAFLYSNPFTFVPAAVRPNSARNPFTFPLFLFTQQHSSNSCPVAIPIHARAVPCGPLDIAILTTTLFQLDAQRTALSRDLSRDFTSHLCSHSATSCAVVKSWHRLPRSYRFFGVHFYPPLANRHTQPRRQLQFFSLRGQASLP